MKTLRKILLVEDNPHDVELTLAAFGRNKLANDVVVARDGAEALDYLYQRGAHADRPPELPIVVFLDLKMP
jgi:CheY-like chemotaxis protein